VAECACVCVWIFVPLSTDLYIYIRVLFFLCEVVLFVRYI